jgi:hypothetical protein
VRTVEREDSISHANFALSTNSGTHIQLCISPLSLQANKCTQTKDLFSIWIITKESCSANITLPKLLNITTDVDVCVCECVDSASLYQKHPPISIACTTPST